MLGKAKMRPEFRPLAEWIDKTYSVKTINIIYDIVDNKTPRIQICFEYEEEKNKFLNLAIGYYNKQKQQEIAEKFTAVIKQQGLSISNSSLSNTSEGDKNDLYVTDNVFVIFGAFEPVAKLDAIDNITQKQQEEFIKSFNNKDIWTISISFGIAIVFLFTDEQVKEYDKPEIKSIWADKYYAFVKPFDAFNYFKRSDIQVYIDSKENFDTNYQSNWYNYYK